MGSGEVSRLVAKIGREDFLDVTGSHFFVTCDWGLFRAPIEVIYFRAACFAISGGERLTQRCKIHSSDQLINR